MDLHPELAAAIERNHKWIQKKCSLSENNHAKSEELVNEVLFNLYTSNSNFSKKDVINADAWVKKITTNVTADHVQKEIRESQFFDRKTKNADIAGKDKSNASHDLQVLTDYMNTQMSAKDREIMSLYMMQEPQVTIAEIIGLEVATITNRISILKKELNEYLNKGQIWLTRKT